MKTAEEIIAILHRALDNYACQDNVYAARTARALRLIIEEVETPPIEELRRKFLGDEQ